MSVGKDGSSLADALRSDQRHRWLTGDRVPLEAYLAQHPELSNDPEQVVSLAYSEFCLRQELGEEPDPQEYLQRFPEHRQRLQELLETHRPKSSAAAAQTTDVSLGVRRELHCPFCAESLPAPDMESVSQLRCSHCGKQVFVVDETLPYKDVVLRVIGRFQLLERLGSGAFGEVWRARDTELDREVAIKIPRRLPEQGSTRRAFLREARAAARLKHPNIVPVYDVGYDKDRVYIVCGLIHGTTLKDHLQQRRFTPQEAARLCETLAGALDHAHQAGIIHRDLKPSNILVDHDGNPYIADFGLAKHPGDELVLTLEGKILGTPAYMSPEQARGDGHRVDHRCDVYSLGVVLYELLTGQRPFMSKGDLLIHDIIHAEPASPRQWNPAIPADLEAICLKALSKNPSARYGSALELAIDLELFQKGEPPAGRPLSRVRRGWRWSRRHRTLVAALGTFFVGCMLTANSMFVDRPANQVPAIPAREVVLETEPAGATIAFIPLDETTGEPRPDQIVRCKDRSPVRLHLAVGDYLVVAIADDYGFHEVYRHVPPTTELNPHYYSHRSWKGMADGAIELPRIVIPPEMVKEGMAPIEGTERFLMGAPDSKQFPQHARRVPAFHIDTREVTLGDYKQAFPGFLPTSMQKNPPPDEYAALLNYNQALHFAEKVGKRLLTETEFEYAATARGTRRFPWGDSIPEEFDPAAESSVPGAVKFDRLPTTPPVFGLCSGVAELTLSCYTDYPGKAGAAPQDRVIDRRVVRGGTKEVIQGDFRISQDYRNPRARSAVMHYNSYPGLGFRCARSSKPRILPEDFVTILSDHVETTPPSD